MSKYYYDLHIHSCLSPCGDEDSTPDSIAGMGELNGLNIMALTDHNSCKNCPAFFQAAARHGIIPIAGMELTTAEDIHTVCLFPTLESAMEFNKVVEKRLVKILNRPDIFGKQLIVDSENNVIEEEPYLLINATDISLDEAPVLVNSYGGICFPAHIDRQSNGIISVLGAFPETPKFVCAEVHNREKLPEYTSAFNNEKKLIINSDAHNLWDIKEATDYIELKDNESVVLQLIEYLKEMV